MISGEEGGAGGVGKTGKTSIEPSFARITVVVLDD